MQAPVSDDELQQAADTYRSAMAAGESPYRALIEQFGYSKPTASRRIVAMRRAGLIDERATGVTNQKALRVANALGVDYFDLINAIREHANGRLCLE